MNVSRISSIGIVTATLALIASLLSACGQDKPEELVASAREFIAKKDYRAASIQLKNALQKQESGEIDYLLAVTLIELGDFTFAELHLRRALEQRYSPDAVYPELARVMLGLSDFKKLAGELGKVSVKDPAAQASMKSAVGESYVALGQTKEAREAFSAALASAPGDPRARIGQARVAAVAGDMIGAGKVTDEVLAKSPGLPQALALKADLLIAGGKPEEAIGVLSELVRAAPFDGQARFALVSLLIAREKLDRAAAEIEAMKNALPGDVRRSYLAAVLAFRQGEPGKARDFVSQLLNVIPDHGPSLLLAGAIEYQLGSLSTAEDYLRKVIARYPNSLYARNLLIATYLRKGQPGKAEDALAPALKLAPKDATVLRAAGEVAFANNRLGEAARYYEEALALEKDSTILRTRLAQIRLASGETNRAILDLEMVSGLDQNQYQADLSLISTHLRQKEYDKALAAVAILETKQPTNPLTYNVKGAVYVAREDVKSARTNFEKALSLQFNYLPAAINLARLDLAAKNPEAAKDRLQAILAKEPTNEGALLSLAQILISIRAPLKEITATLERAIRAAPSSAPPRIALINFLARSRDPKAALTAAQTANVAMPNEPRILDALGLAQLANGLANEAIETFNRLAAAMPDSPLPLMRLAAAQSAARQIEAPVQALQKALVMKPDLLEAQREIIVAQLAAGRPEEALKEAKSVQKARPKEAIGFALEGDVLANQKKLAEAANAYGEAIKRQPAPAMVVNQHQLLRAAGKSAEADAVAAKWLKEHPKDLIMRFYLATKAAQSKDYRAAVERYQEILALQPDNVSILNNLAWVLGELKDPAALSYAEKAYTKEPTNAEALDTYGWLLYDKGETKRGIDLLTLASAAAPKAAEVRMHLAKALLRSGDKAGAKRELAAVVQLGEKFPSLKAEAAQLLQSL